MSITQSRGPNPIELSRSISPPWSSTAYACRTQSHSRRAHSNPFALRLDLGDETTFDRPNTERMSKRNDDRQRIRDIVSRKPSRAAIELNNNTQY
jgi:hypothetical protein